MSDEASIQTLQATLRVSLAAIINSVSEEIEGFPNRCHGIEDNPYPLPNDDEEAKRLDDLQDVCRYILNANVLAPISPKADNILDIGTGSGAWAVEVADQFPNALVRGLDLSPIQPLYVPQNCEFLVGDLNEGLDFDDNSIDLVHSRVLMAGVTRTQWPNYMKEVYRILKPGIGWVQCGEFDPLLRSANNSAPKDSPLFEFQNYTMMKLTTPPFGKDLIMNGEHLEKTITDAGFVDVKVRQIALPSGIRSKDVKRREFEKKATNVWTGAMEPLVNAFMSDKYPDEAERNDFIDKVREEMENPHYRLYSPMYFVIGRKPETKDEPTKEASA